MNIELTNDDIDLIANRFAQKYGGNAHVSGFLELAEKSGRESAELYANKTFGREHDEADRKILEPLVSKSVSDLLPEIVENIIQGQLRRAVREEMKDLLLNGESD